MLVNSGVRTGNCRAQNYGADFESLVGLRALIVDNDTDSRALTSFILENCSAEVITAGLAMEALGVIKQLQPQILISAIAMPVMNGYSLVRSLRELNCPLRTIPAIALTTQDSEDALAFEAGFQACLLKPINPDDLVIQIIKLLDLPCQPG
ncbi:hypothetical protein NIES2101_41755 [Calothrix sp. HK-06]|nr:hypothetical protein NIES2101_41755 [Calothrix sp. HK-06]